MVDKKLKVVIITGMSGAGKPLPFILEDLGYFVMITCFLDWQNVLLMDRRFERV